MKKNDDTSQKKTTIFILLASLAVYAMACIFSFHYERLTGDATLYLSIAEKYIRGDLGNAINGYWGPLLSWLLIPFLFFGSSHVFAMNALNLVFGVLTIIGVWKLSFRFEIQERIRSIIIIPLAPVVLFVSLIEPMDFLLLSVLVYYLSIVFSKAYPSRLRNGVISGLLGACAYFSKPYGFPFFITHFTVMNICHYLRDASGRHKKNVLRNALIGFVIFFFLSGVWIALISNKYNRLTFSNMGRGVFASLGPESEHDTLEKGDPILFKGFFEPPNETAFIIYEDPSYARKETWSPVESRSSLKHFASNFIKNIINGIRIYESYSRLSVAIIIAYILLVFALPANQLRAQGELLYPLLTVIVYSGGYMPFHFETRYLWIVNILLLLMGGKVLSELFHHDFFKSGRIQNILTVLFILSFVITPLKSSAGISRSNFNREMYILGTELSRKYDLKGNIASNRQKVKISSHDAWHQTFRLAYWLKGRYFGQARENISDDDLERELKMFDIDYYFLWGNAARFPRFLSRYRELTGGDIEELRIYSLKEPAEGERKNSLIYQENTQQSLHPEKSGKR